MTRLACPWCKNPDHLATLERINGLADVRVTLDTNQKPEQPDYEWNGDTKMFWDTSETVGITCRNCGWEHDGNEYLYEQLVPVDIVVTKRDGARGGKSVVVEEGGEQ